MFEFKKLCDAYESLSTVEKGLIVTEKSVKILAKLKLLDLPGIDPVSTLAGFMIGSAAADGKINEREYLLMYPALINVFGYNFDFHSIKQSFSGRLGAKKLMNEYLERMLKIFAEIDESLKEDIVMLCLCVVAIDGKISLRERRYIRCLCKS